MRYFFSKILMTLCIALCCTSCAEEFAVTETAPGMSGDITIIADREDFGFTRAAYSGVASTFDVGDRIGVYAVNGTTAVASNIPFTWDGTKWNSTTDVVYNADYDYYAYYPYVASPYTPDFTQTGIKAQFATFIEDASEKFHQADQSTKAAFNASDLMIAKAVHLSPHVVKFSMEHKKALAVFNGASAASATFSGDNIPYLETNTQYYIMKPGTSTTFTNNANGTCALYASSGKYVTHKVSAYLTFVAIESGTFSFNLSGLSYSLDDGETWTALAGSANTPTVTAGSSIMWKNNTTLTPNSSEGIGKFSSTGKFNIEGNIMSLLYGDAAAGQVDLTGKEYAFYSLFNNKKIVNSKDLFLPATTLASNCYNNMFGDCRFLISAPKLPATTLATYCYQSMFRSCEALTTAPELPATTLAVCCYQYMFRDCYSLTAAPELPATTLATVCYGGMFQNCTSLITAPELPCTTLASGCYASMFWGCTSMTTAPDLLPATTLDNSCYSKMFADCTSLTTAPELPATTLISSCYNNMFQGCTKLKYVKAAFTTTPSSTYTSNWLEGVAATGTFYKNAAAEWDVTGASGVPSGWTVETYTP